MKGLADGSPDIEEFRFFIVQDHMYLDRLIRALAMNTCFETRLTDWRIGPLVPPHLKLLSKSLFSIAQ